MKRGMRGIVAILLCVLLLGGCASKKAEMRIGRDPTWYPTDLQGKTEQVNGFVNALFQAIGTQETLAFQLVNSDWISLFPDLEEGKYAGVVSGLPPTVQNLDLYDFSDPILPLGPVLVVPKGSAITSIHDLTGKRVGVSPYGSGLMIVQTNPAALIEPYDNLPTAMEELTSGEIEAALIPSLVAEALVPTRFASELQIASAPLDDEALRLLTLKGEQRTLMSLFNKELKSLKQSSDYQGLQKKFHVD